MHVTSDGGGSGIRQDNKQSGEPKHKHSWRYRSPSLFPSSLLNSAQPLETIPHLRISSMIAPSSWPWRSHTINRTKARARYSVLALVQQQTKDQQI
ncbi:hypothetical protein FOVSG1_002380 [Fusarium oxysporum f. sp. vasinfectum]